VQVEEGVAQVELVKMVQPLELVQAMVLLALKAEEGFVVQVLV